MTSDAEFVEPSGEGPEGGGDRPSSSATTRSSVSRSASAAHPQPNR